MPYPNYHRSDRRSTKPRYCASQMSSSLPLFDLGLLKALAATRAMGDAAFGPALTRPELLASLGIKQGG